MPTTQCQRALTASGCWGRRELLAGLLPLALCMARCDATPRGHLVLELELRAPEGVSLTCADLGAQELELSLFARGDDVLPYDRVAWPCAVEPHAVTVDARRYARVEARLVGSGGATVRLCQPEGTVEARFAVAGLEVSEGDRVPLPWTLVGAPGSCPAP